MKVICEHAVECLATGQHDDCRHTVPHESRAPGEEDCREPMDCIDFDEARCIPVAQPDWDK